MMDKLGQATVVDFDVSLPSSNLLPLEPESAEIEGHLAFFGEFIFSAGILRYEHTNDSDTPSRFCRGNKVIHSEVIGLMTVAVAALITNTLTSSIGAFAVSQI